mgnify:CR=1 FL=1
MKKIGFIGMGNMAGAIAAGIIQKGLMKKDEVFAYAPHYDKLVKNAEKIIKNSVFSIDKYKD